MKKIRCPRCQQETVFSAENPFRPFCSDRCKTLDLGAWATENYRIPDTENSHLNNNSNKTEDETSEDSVITSDKNNLH